MLDWILSSLLVSHDHRHVVVHGGLADLLRCDRVEQLLPHHELCQSVLLLLLLKGLARLSLLQKCGYHALHLLKKHQHLVVLQFLRLSGTHG